MRGSWALSGKQRDTGPEPYYMSSGGVFSHEFFFVSLFHLFHFALCSGVRVFGEETGKSRRKGRVSGKDNGTVGGLVSMSN